MRLVHPMNYCEILQNVKTIAVVGISNKEERDSGRIAKFLQSKNYNIVGIHPVLENVFGIPVYKSLTDVPVQVDLVDVFLGSDKILSLIPDIKQIKPKYVWLQLGIYNEKFIEELQQASIEVIYDACIAIEYQHCQRVGK
jgi:uncharacterized protein